MDLGHQQPSKRLRRGGVDFLNCLEGKPSGASDLGELQMQPSRILERVLDPSTPGSKEPLGVLLQFRLLDILAHASALMHKLLVLTLLLPLPLS